jgi:hypothetical protein
MRHVNRDGARNSRVPDDAVILEETPHRVIFVSEKTLRILHLREITSSCSECGSLWVAQMDFEMKLTDILRRSINQ